MNMLKSLTFLLLVLSSGIFPLNSKVNCNEIDKRIISFLNNHYINYYDPFSTIVKPSSKYEYQVKEDYEIIVERIINNSKNILLEMRISFDQISSSIQVVSNSYDTKNRNENEILNLRSSEEVIFIYDGKGNLLEWKNPYVNRIFEYDLKGRVIQEIENESYITEVEYDDNYSKKISRDKEGNAKEIEIVYYNELGQISKVEHRHKEFSSETFNKSYLYDSAGRLLREFTDKYTRKSNYENIYEYDDCGLLSRKKYLDDNKLKSDTYYRYEFDLDTKTMQIFITTYSLEKDEYFESKETLSFDEKGNWVTREVISSSGNIKTYFRNIKYRK